MRAQPNTADELIEMVAATLAHPSSHAYRKHVCESNEFNDPCLGPPLGISSPEGLKEHLVSCMRDEANIVTMHGSAAYIYHEGSGTVVMVNPNGRLGSKDGGTTFRNDPARERDGEKWFERHLQRDAERLGISTQQISDVRTTFRDFLAANTAYAQLLMAEFMPVYQAKMSPAKTLSPEPAVRPPLPLGSI